MPSTMSETISEFAKKNRVDVSAAEVDNVMEEAAYYIDQLKVWLQATVNSENVKQAANSFRNASVEAMSHIQKELGLIAKQNQSKIETMGNLEATQFENSKRIAELEAQIMFLYKFIFGFIIFLCLLLLIFDKLGKQKVSKTIIYHKGQTDEETDGEFEI